MLREPSQVNPSPVTLARQNALKAQNLSAFRLIPPLLRPYWRKMACGLIAVLVAGSATLGLGKIFQHLVDYGLRSDNLQALGSGLLSLLGLVVILAIASYIRLVILTGTTELMMANLRRTIFNHLVHLDVTWFEKQKIGDIMARMSADISLLQVLFGTSMPVALRNLLLVSGGLIMMATSSPSLSGFVLLLVPALVLILISIGPSVRKNGKFLQEQTGIMNAHLNENLNAIRETQAFSQETTQAAEFGLLNDNVVQATWQYVRKRGLLSSLVITVVFSSIAGLLWVGGKQVIEGTLSPGQLSAFVFYAMLVAGSSGTLSEIYGDLLRAAGALERIDEILQARSSIQSPEKPVTLDEKPTGLLQFHDVVFSYPTRQDVMAMDHLSTTFAPGQITAIVGPSGSGKTTLLNLLLRFYDPAAGHITFDNIDIRQFEPSAYRTLFSLVPQDPALFSTSLRDNIAFSQPQATTEQIEQAAKTAGAHDFIMQFPDGYNTILGERGTRLSGGQAQRIALARALLRDPTVLLLDEATAHLDSETETAVHNALRFNRQNRTTIIIAHRLSTIRHADRILVMDHGKLVASGTHDELFTQSELYRRLATSQLQ